MPASHGLLEVRCPQSGEAAAEGEAGTLVLTPFPPYRETSVLLRYDTQDVVRPLPGPLTCTLRHLSATSHLLGKLGACVRDAAGWTFPRDVLEALESLEDVPLPARYGFYAAPGGGVVVEVVARADTQQVRRAIAAALQEHGVDVRELRVVLDRRELRRPLPLRADLCEMTFDTQEATVRRVAGVGRA